jgi:hypothetical protein
MAAQVEYNTQFSVNFGGLLKLLITLYNGSQKAAEVY